MTNKSGITAIVNLKKLNEQIVKSLEGDQRAVQEDIDYQLNELMASNLTLVKHQAERDVYRDMLDNKHTPLPGIHRKIVEERAAKAEKTIKRLATELTATQKTIESRLIDKGLEAQIKEFGKELNLKDSVTAAAIIHQDARVEIDDEGNLKTSFTYKKGGSWIDGHTGNPLTLRGRLRLLKNEKPYLFNDGPGKSQTGNIATFPDNSRQNLSAVQRAAIDRKQMLAQIGR